MCPLFLKLSSISKLSILTTKFLVNIKTQGFYSCLILTENFLVNIKTQNFYSCLILTENFLGNIKTQIVFILPENFSDNILKFVVLSDEQPKSKKLPNFYFAKIRTYTSSRTLIIESESSKVISVVKNIKKLLTIRIQNW